MYLRDYLHDIPLKALKNIADALNIEVEYRARIKLMNAIDRAFWDGTLTERLIGDLSEDHVGVLSIIAFSYRAGVPEQVLARKAEKLGFPGDRKKSVRDIVHELIPLGLVGGIEDEESRFFCPEGVAEQIRKLLLIDDPTFREGESTAPMFSPANLLEDIYSFLSSVNKQPLPLTLMGKVKKSVLERMFGDSPTCRDDSLRFDGDRRNSFVMEYARERGLVRFGNREVRITPKLHGWLSLTMTERMHDIVSFALEHLLRDVYAVVSIAGLFRELQPGMWFEEPDLTRFLHTRTAAAGGEKRIGPRLRETLAVLNQLGLLSMKDGGFSLTDSGARLFRGEKLPMDETSSRYFTVQPNFEVIAGPELAPRTRFLLDLLAERKSRDTVLTFAVTQEGVARARERGMSTDDIMRFFQDHSRTPLPQNVQFSIESWANSYGSIFFENVTLMRCRTPEICESIAHTPDISSYILEQLSDNTLVVSSKHIQVITGHLKKAGFLPEAFGETVPDPVLSGEDFSPTAVTSMVEEHSLPDIHHSFVFPEHLLREGGEP